MLKNMILLLIISILFIGCDSCANASDKKYKPIKYNYSYTDYKEKISVKEFTPQSDNKASCILIEDFSYKTTSVSCFVKSKFK